jgi:ATP-dependent DNA helicase RecQ
MEVFIETLIQRFQKREDNDIKRIEGVLRLAQHRGCITQYLLNYFGEKRDPCGHCSQCQGGPPIVLDDAQPYVFTGQDEQRIRGLVSAGHASIKRPRQLARFLCGITSPATTRARLRKESNLFGAYDSIPFKSVMEYVDGLHGA